VGNRRGDQRECDGEGCIEARAIIATRGRGLGS
jgi:hypothetical protein